ncbi:MAG TPA: PKD domain-containing protein [Thermoleophilaceae bacterium]|nr:PKD domain-containing protein [Thermoleophilaceae bacterium]
MASVLRPASCFALAVAALVVAVSWPALAGPPGVDVAIVKPDGTRAPSFIASEADHDLKGTRKVRQPDGSMTTVQIVDGISIYSLLEKAGVQSGYDAVEFVRADGTGKVRLTREQVEGVWPPGIFADDDTGAVMFIGAPPREGVDYVQARDYFELDGAALELTQLEDDVEVEVDASRTRIEAGESVEFTVEVEPEGNYRYNWTFEPGVGSKDAGKTVTHRFKKAGRYKVAVGVYTAADEEHSAGDGGITIQVGDPRESDKNREGGGDNGAAAAPDSGAATGSDGAAAYTPSYTPSYTPPAPSTPVTPTPPTSPPTLTPDPPKRPDIATSSGTTVEGNLLADASDPPSNILESAARAARDGNPRDDEANHGGGVPEAALSVAGALALLGLGAGIETRQGRLPRLRLPRRGA